MKLDEWIKRHNELLERRAYEDGYFSARLKVRLRGEVKTLKENGVGAGRPAWGWYGILFILLTLAHFLLLDMLEPPAPTVSHWLAASSDDFRGDYPGSVSSALRKAVP